jgi:hypothetical protein
MGPHRVIVAHGSGDLTSAQRVTLRAHYIVGTVRCSRRWIRSASVRTEVKDVLTLLVKSRQSISHAMGVRFARGISAVSLAFTRRIRDRFAARY